MASQPNGDAVGYKRPPKDKRYQKGFSGNPRGRPKGSRSSVSILREVLCQTVRITDGDTTRKITKAEALIKVILLEARKGTRHYADVLITLCDRIERLVEIPLAQRGGIMLVPGVAKSDEEFKQMVREVEEDRALRAEMQKAAQSMQNACERPQPTVVENPKQNPRNLKRRTANSPPTVLTRFPLPPSFMKE